jgi:small-conductance mechanosensitive channel
VSGTAIGSLIGLLGGPVGLAVGALTGTMVGSLADLFVAGVDSDFLTEVSNVLTPGKCAIVADVSEEWVTPVDTRMEALNGFVYRTARKSFEEAQRASEVAELRAEIDQLKAEHARAKAEHKAKLQGKIDQLNTRLQTKLQQARQRKEQIQNETEAKVQALQAKAAKAKGDAKAAINARATEIKKQYERWAEQVTSMVA